MDVFDVAWKVAAAGVSVSIGLLVVKEVAPQIRGIVILVFVGITLGLVVTLMTQLVGAMKEMVAHVPLLDKSFGILLKVVGVAYAVELAAAICTDCGEGAIATKIQIVGRIVLMLIALPLVMHLVKLILKLLDGIM